MLFFVHLQVFTFTLSNFLNFSWHVSFLTYYFNVYDVMLDFDKLYIGVLFLNFVA